MKIFLLRHGESTGDVEGRYGGDYDDHLSEHGKKQALVLAERLKGKGIEVVFYSVRIRAKETAEMLSEKLGVEMRPNGNIRERNNYGIITGMTKEEAKDKHFREVEKLSIDPINHEITDSESYDFFKQRVMIGFQDIIEKSKDHDIIAIITHGGPIRCLLREILDLELSYLGDCAVIELKIIDGKIDLVKMQGASLKN